MHAHSYVGACAHYACLLACLPVPLQVMLFAALAFGWLLLVLLLPSLYRLFVDYPLRLLWNLVK